ncbi:MAG TPA: lysophospholipid acyltransferase family protein [Rariglobus sp.]|jgi:1-acyl-sn-glycerol-3-phosphate acyltransferase|nr:lysophospholipid acyltransferase family protein [Rariglobus sp.]
MVIVFSMMDYASNRRNRCDAVGKALWLQRTCRRALQVLAVSIESAGTPAHGAVIVSNHLSYLDILILAAVTPVVFVSKKEVRNWPIFGWFAEKAGTRFIDRGKRGDVRRIAEEIGPVMRADLTVVLFLEGTTTDGAGVLPFKSALLEPVVAQGWKIVPAAVGYDVPAGRSAKNEVCWWGDMTLAPHLLNFTTLPWVRAKIAWGGPLIASGDRKLLAETIREQVLVLKSELS